MKRVLMAVSAFLLYFPVLNAADGNALRQQGEPLNSPKENSPKERAQLALLQIFNINIIQQSIPATSQQERPERLLASRKKRRLNSQLGVVPRPEHEDLRQRALAELSSLAMADARAVQAGPSQEVEDSSDRPKKLRRLIRCAAIGPRSSSPSLQELLEQPEELQVAQVVPRDASTGQSRQKLPCNECDKQFARRSGLYKHIRSVHKGEKFTCNECDKQFAHSSSLNRHIQSVHKGEKFPCNACDDKQFTTRDHLNRHIRSVHEGQKFTCDICKTPFTKRGSLKRHIRSKHEGHRFPCDRCNKQFKGRSGLYEHKRSKHADQNS